MQYIVHGCFIINKAFLYNEIYAPQSEQWWTMRLHAQTFLRVTVGYCMYQCEVSLNAGSQDPQRSFAHKTLDDGYTFYFVVPENQTCMGQRVYEPIPRLDSIEQGRENSQWVRRKYASRIKRGSSKYNIAIIAIQKTFINLHRSWDSEVAKPRGIEFARSSLLLSLAKYMNLKHNLQEYWQSNMLKVNLRTWSFTTFQVAKTHIAYCISCAPHGCTNSTLP